VPRGVGRCVGGNRSTCADVQMGGLSDQLEALLHHHTNAQSLVAALTLAGKSPSQLICTVTSLWRRIAAVNLPVTPQAYCMGETIRYGSQI
jgi:hypothetical protein